MVLDDFGIPTKSEVQHQPEMISRYDYADATPAQQAAPIERVSAQPVQQAAPIERAYAQPGQAVQQAYAQPSPAVVIVQAPAQAPTIIQLARSGSGAAAAGVLRVSSCSGGLRVSSSGLWISANRISGLLPALLRKRRCPMFFCRLWALPGACGLAGGHTVVCAFLQ